MPSSALATTSLELAINQLELLTQPAVAGAGGLSELQIRIHCYRWGLGWVDEIHLSQLPSSWELTTRQLGVLTQPALAGDISLVELQ